MKSSYTNITLALASLLRLGVYATPVTSAQGPLANLGYATYEGTRLQNGVNQFLGMRYAAPPVGKNRFRLPQKPDVVTSGTVMAKTHGPICFEISDPFVLGVGLPTSEDCLFIDVYTPQASNNTTGHPVMVWLQGGGFNELDTPNYNGTGLVKASNDSVIIVSFNYRVGPYGFLASEELAAEGSLNVGLHDQRAAIQWVQQHIAQFGGDPEHITLFGTSIGGGSVLLQTLAYGGKQPSPDGVEWQAGIAAAPYIPTFSRVEDVEHQYQAILNATDCSDLACLRNLNSTQIQSVNIANPFPGQSQVPLFPYGVTIDGNLLTDAASEMLSNGQFATHRPLIIGSSWTEGTLFATQASTTADISTFLRTQYPRLQNDTLATAEGIYANVPRQIPGSQSSSSPLYSRLAYMYGDIGFASQALGFALAVSHAGGHAYLFRDDIRDPVEVAAGYGTPHTWEVQAVWGPQYARNYVALPNATSYNVGGVNHDMVKVVQSLWLNFAVSRGDPNLGARSGSLSPRWKPFDPVQPHRLRLRSNATAMEPVADWELERRTFWRSVANETQI